MIFFFFSFLFKLSLSIFLKTFNIGGSFLYYFSSMELIQLTIKGISFNQVQEGIYALLLEEKKSESKLPIIIGGLEAQTIAVALGKEKEKKQVFIYSLFASFFESFKISLEKIILYKMEEGIFFSYLICKNGQCEEKIHSRASHALALAIYFEVPIYVTKEIFTNFSINSEADHLFEIKSEKNIYLNNFSKVSKFENNLDLKKMTIENLNLLLEEALGGEYYEFAMLIKKELDERENI